MRSRGPIPLLLLLAALAPCGFAADAQEAKSWFRTDPRALPYVGVESRILALFSDAEGRRLPEGALLAKLKEGASKRVDPEKLFLAMKDELERLTVAQGILGRAGMGFQNPSARDSAIRDLGIYLLGGLDAGVLEHVLTRTASLARGYPDALACIEALGKLRETTLLDGTDLRRIGTALLGSRVPVSGYKSIPSVFLRAKGMRMAEREILEEIVLKTLEGGGGLVQMEEELARRARKR